MTQMTIYTVILFIGEKYVAERVYLPAGQVTARAEIERIIAASHGPQAAVVALIPGNHPTDIDETRPGDYNVRNVEHFAAS
tara:strand:- start:163 stop:405 length:243 start_codon:yes stop_codon:yes gene_type:complete